ncbi:unnamed protein product, partial [Rotaria magnacalcarata]
MSTSNNFKRKSFAGQNSAAPPPSGTQIKRPKRANDDDDDDFGNDDPAFDDADLENKENAIELGHGPAYEATNVKWARPDIPSIDPLKEKLVFQQIDLDTYTDT